MGFKTSQKEVVKFGAEIRRLRKLNKMTQAELAEKMGVTFQAISSWEQDRTQPKAGDVQRLMDIFGCKLEGIKHIVTALTYDEYDKVINQRDNKGYTLNHENPKLEEFGDYQPFLVTSGERRLLEELRDCGRVIDEKVLEEMFNKILRYKADSTNPIDVDEPMVFEIRATQYLGKKK